mmetsp:Transcript_105510/g.128791  ORF Transcript_105510/g.128791 Transcript_105510/m.128791 type:complete len:252 (-) Transcript_105510:1-756(-)
MSYAERKIKFDIMKLEDIFGHIFSNDIITDKMKENKNNINDTIDALFNKQSTKQFDILSSKKKKKKKNAKTVKECDIYTNSMNGIKCCISGYVRNEYGNNVPKSILDIILNEILNFKETLYLGHLHKTIEAISDNSHEWCMFLSNNKDKYCKPLTVDCVTYILHRTFRPYYQTIKDAPYYLKRRGWGIFNVKVIIKYKEINGKTFCKKPKHVYVGQHQLSFGHRCSMTDLTDKYGYMNKIKIDDKNFLKMP